MPKISRKIVKSPSKFARKEKNGKFITKAATRGVAAGYASTKRDRGALYVDRGKRFCKRRGWAQARLSLPAGSAEAELER